MERNESNPFAAPQSEVLSSDPRHSMLGDVWRDGDLLVVRDKTSLPDRCVKCNDSSDVRRLKRRMSWHSPMLYLLILLNLILYAIVAIAVQKKGRVEFALCPQHLRQRRIAIAVGWFGALAFVAMLVIAFSADPRRRPLMDTTGFWILGAFAVLATSLIFAIIRSQPLKATRIGNGVLWLKGAGLPFLNSIDENSQRKLL
jgi:hypothetical protein